MEQQKDPKDGQRTRDPRERAELERVSGDEYVDRPGDDQAASDDAPLPETGDR
jgi:hypothetical protein